MTLQILYKSICHLHPQTGKKIWRQLALENISHSSSRNLLYLMMNIAWRSIYSRTLHFFFLSMMRISFSTMPTPLDLQSTIRHSKALMRRTTIRSWPLQSTQSWTWTDNLAKTSQPIALTVASRKHFQNRCGIIHQTKWKNDQDSIEVGWIPLNHIKYHWIGLDSLD